TKPSGSSRRVSSATSTAGPKSRRRWPRTARSDGAPAPRPHIRGWPGGKGAGFVPNVLITGAASGIGAGLGAELARSGHHVILGDLKLADVERVAAELRAAGGSAEAVALDVTSDTSVAAALA